MFEAPFDYLLSIVKPERSGDNREATACSGGAMATRVVAFGGFSRRFVRFSDALEALLERKANLMTTCPIENPCLRAAAGAS